MNYKNTSVRISFVTHTTLLLPSIAKPITNMLSKAIPLLLVYVKYYHHYMKLQLKNDFYFFY